MEKQKHKLQRKKSYAIFVVLSKELDADQMVIFNSHLKKLLELSVTESVLDVDIDWIIQVVNEVKQLESEVNYQKYIKSELVKELVTFLSLLKSPPEEG